MKASTAGLHFSQSLQFRVDGEFHQIFFCVQTQQKLSLSYIFQIITSHVQEELQITIVSEHSKKLFLI